VEDVRRTRSLTVEQAVAYLEQQPMPSRRAAARSAALRMVLRNQNPPRGGPNPMNNPHIMGLVASKLRRTNAARFAAVSRTARDEARRVFDQLQLCIVTDDAKRVRIDMHSREHPYQGRQWMQGWDAIPYNHGPPVYMIRRHRNQFISAIPAKYMAKYPTKQHLLAQLEKRMALFKNKLPASYTFLLLDHTQNVIRYPGFPDMLRESTLLLMLYRGVELLCKDPAALREIIAWMKLLGLITYRTRPASLYNDLMTLAAQTSYGVLYAILAIFGFLDNQTIGSFDNYRKRNRGPRVPNSDDSDDNYY